MKSLLLSIMLALALVSSAADARKSYHRDRHERAEFQHQHPCPSTGKRSGSCPGYIVDHVKPLCKGGPDKRSNMQWQSRADAKAKDKWECKR